MSDLALSIKNVSRDLEVQKYPPILTPEEEYNLAIELYEDGSLSAAQKLVLAHMRFVAFVAHGYKGYGLAGRFNSRRHNWLNEGSQTF